MVLKVKDKYPDVYSNEWRTDSVPEEWPVTFHGTSLDESIGHRHYKPGSGTAFGSGIYSTPDIQYKLLRVSAMPRPSYRRQQGKVTK